MKRNMGHRLVHLKACQAVTSGPFQSLMSNEHYRLVCMLYRVPLSDVVQSSVVQEGTQTGGTCLELTVISILS